MTEKLKEERDKVMKEKEIYQEGYQDGKLFVKELENKKVKRLKEEIDNEIFYKGSSVIMRINSIMGDFEDSQALKQDRRQSDNKKGVCSHPSPDNTLGCGNERPQRKTFCQLFKGHEGSHQAIIYWEGEECQKSGDFENHSPNTLNIREQGEKE